MSELDEVEATKAKTWVTIAMHETTNQKFGAMSAGIIIVSIVIGLINKSFWPFVIGVIVSFVVSYVIRLSCYRRVQRTTGLPRVAQDHLLALYKNDKNFAAAVERGRNDDTENIKVKYSPENLASIVALHRSVLNEIVARDTVFRANFDDSERRKAMPFAHWGREFMQQEEFDVWVKLNERKISANEAVEEITDVMEKYYGTPYPLR